MRVSRQRMQYKRILNDNDLKKMIRQSMIDGAAEAGQTVEEYQKDVESFYEYFFGDKAPCIKE